MALLCNVQGLLAHWNGIHEASRGHLLRVDQASKISGVTKLSKRSISGLSGSLSKCRYRKAVLGGRPGFGGMTNRGKVAARSPLSSASSCFFYANHPPALILKPVSCQMKTARAAGEEM